MDNHVVKIADFGLSQKMFLQVTGVYYAKYYCSGWRLGKNYKLRRGVGGGELNGRERENIAS